MTRDWISAHLFHRGSLDGLAAGAVGPLIAELTGAGLLAGHFFLRYWEGGPHLRLRLLPAAPGEAGRVRAAVLRHGTRYLAGHPSPPAPAEHTEAAYQELAIRLAAAERRTHHDARVYPADTIQWIGYHPEHDAYGPRPALDAVEDHFAESSRIALELIAAGTPAGERHAAVLAMLTLTVAACDPDPGRVGRRMRDRMASVADDDHARLRPVLRRQARDLWPYAENPDGLGGPLAAWVRSIRAVRDRLRAEQAAGRFAPADAVSPMSTLTAAAGPGDPAVTRVLLRCAHLLANRLGVHGTAEARITALLARTLADLAPAPAATR